VPCSQPAAAWRSYWTFPHCRLDHAQDRSAGITAVAPEVFELFGRAPLGARQQVQLLRCGNKLLLVSVTAAGAETLTEVTDPIEVDRIAGLCRQAHPKRAATAFRQVFQQVAPAPARRRKPTNSSDWPATEAIPLGEIMPERKNRKSQISI